MIGADEKKRWVCGAKENSPHFYTSSLGFEGKKGWTRRRQSRGLRGKKGLGKPGLRELTECIKVLATSLGVSSMPVELMELMKLGPTIWAKHFRLIK